MLKNIKLFYHDRTEDGGTLTKNIEELEVNTIKEVKNILYMNGYILDAIHYLNNDKITLYTKRLNKDIIYYN